MAQNFSLIVDNVYKYGAIYKKTFLPINESFSNQMFYVITAGFGIFWAAQISVEYFAVKGKLTDRTHHILSFLVCGGIMIYAPVMNYTFKLGLMPCLMLNMWAIINCFKLISYAHTMHTSRHIVERLRKYYQTPENKRQDVSLVIKPYEVNQQNLAILIKAVDDDSYLINARGLLTYPIEPTLCYQLSFPRTNKIRWFWLVKRLTEYFMANGLILFLFGQYMVPILERAAQIYTDDGFTLELVGRLFKMSVPCVIAWILNFFAGFQALCNIFAEITYFADRQFYLEWWNSRTFQEYWKYWNLPVHHFILKHIYGPICKRGFNPALGNLVAFFISALLHEYVICFGLWIPTYYFFLGMFVNSIAIIAEGPINKYWQFDRSNVGNVMFWFQFCVLGQPMILLMYYLDAVKYGIVSLPTT